MPCSSRLNTGATVVILASVSGLLHGDVVDFIAVILAGAALVTTHFLVLLITLRTEHAPKRLRYLAFVPVLTPFIAFHLGKRAASIVWFGVLAAYVTIRVINA